MSTNGSVESETFFTKSHPDTFGTYNLADEDLHREHQVSSPHYSLTETQYMGFSVPEHDLRCYVWTWCHPNLGVVSSAITAWQGVQTNMLASPLFDFRNFMSIDALSNGLVDYQLDNGLQVEMTVPGREFRLRYLDEARGNSFDVVQTAVSDPLVWPTNNHFEQVLHCVGEIVLRGERFEVDSYTVRDRSFGEYRSERPVEAPPASWLTAVLEDGVTLCVVATDDPALDPVWKGEYEVDEDRLHHFGWVLADGRPSVIVESHALTRFDEDTLFPTSVSLEVVDAEQRRYTLEGTVTAASPLTTMANQRVIPGLVKWTGHGGGGYGEMQHWQFTDFVHAHTTRQRPKAPTPEGGRSA